MKCRIRCLLALAFVLLISLEVSAIEVSYGSFFTVSGIVMQKERLVLPLDRGKYANVRILDKETFAWVSQCSDACTQQYQDAKIRVVSLRAAQARSGMWIAEVAVDNRWLLTFLIFQNPNGYSFIKPDSVKIHNTGWLKQVEAQLQEQVVQKEREK